MSNGLWDKVLTSRIFVLRWLKQHSAPSAHCAYQALGIDVDLAKVLLIIKDTKHSHV